MKWVLLALCLPISMLCAYAVAADEKPSETKRKDREPVKLTEEALRIHRDAILIDGHNDLPWQYRKKKDFSFRKIDLTQAQPSLHTDIPRLQKGGVGAQFWSAYVPAESRKR